MRDRYGSSWSFELLTRLTLHAVDLQPATDGIMKAPLYVQILENTLLPFLRDVFPNGHRFMQDNDLEHTSRLAWQFIHDNDVHWWKTPPESPDANRLENMWHELNEYVYSARG